MPRNHSRSSSRPSSNPVRTAAPQRPAHTSAAAPPPTPAAATPTPIVVPQREGILTQIATTAAGVATGHVIGRMVTGLFTGGSNEAAAPVESSTQPLNRSVAPQCQEYSKLFLQCMEQNGNQVGTCQDYMDMMKSCQQQYA